MTDAALPDAGVPPPGPCTAGTPAMCRGDNVVMCVGGNETYTDCQAASGYCEGGACRPWVCEPSSRTCNSDRSAVVACDARGAGEQLIGCPTGICDPTRGQCQGVGPDRCGSVDAIEVGETRQIDLCAARDQNTFVPQMDCEGDMRANAGDIVLRLEVGEPTSVSIDLDDADVLARIDTVLYVRRICDTEDTQIACSDDTPCGFPGIGCTDGQDIGHSHLDLDLEAGTYYLVLDGRLRTSGGSNTMCGLVAVRVRTAG